MAAHLATQQYTMPFSVAATAKFFLLIWYPLLVIVSDGNLMYIYVYSREDTDADMQFRNW